MKIFAGLIAAVLLVGLYWLEQREENAPLPAEYAQGPEARSWLRKSQNESALASNRFGETRDALQFVEQLYRAGAKRVAVPMAAIQTDDTETYADSLVVTLPARASLPATTACCCGGIELRHGSARLKCRPEAPFATARARIGDRSWPFA
jgi:hypothetical protein